MELLQNPKYESKKYIDSAASRGRENTYQCTIIEENRREAEAQVDLLLGGVSDRRYCSRQNLRPIRQQKCIPNSVTISGSSETF